jgi:hypothetical protein
LISGGQLGTALQAATVGGSLEVLTLLLQNGADLKIPGGYLQELHIRENNGFQEAIMGQCSRLQLWGATLSF